MDFECESGNCGSTSFRVGDDGYTYCSEGHRQLSRGTQFAEENEGAPQFGRKARRLGEEEEAIDTALTGKRAFEHYLLCFQLVLWKQVHWLISVKSFPVEFETMVRDLWALRLQTLQSRATYESESEAEHSSQLWSSQSEAEATDASTKRKSRRSKIDAIPQLVDAVSLCYIGSLLLRLPVAVNDYHQWIASGDLIYYRAVTTLSPSMKLRLPFNFSQALDPQNILKASSLHKAVIDNITAYSSSFGMRVPPLNHILLLYRWMGDLALPLEVYAAVLRIAKLIDVHFDYEVEGQRRPARFLVLRLAEAKLMSLIVVATKLLFPMDGGKRYPRKPTELAALAMDWSIWTSSREQHEQSEKDTQRLGYEDALRISESDVLEMSDDKLDDYMDWYGSTFAVEHVREHGRASKEAEFRRAMFRYFPIDRAPGETEQEAREEQVSDDLTRLRGDRIKEVQSALKPLRVRQDGDTMRDGEVIQRPGSHYKRFRSVNELSGYAEEFYKEAAKVSGLGLDSLVRAVFTMEKRIEDLEAKARKADQSSHMVEG
ncbi:hypothetical protein AAFC00_002262 [Neodothiora populina]|uniref:RRN7-type domain-containing protein n=1 Tax=Neodothiora populina TaxID=2781224 RepID=A0ABR3PGU2_9PEZI